MYNDQTHPLLAQVPLTVSPFVSLPTATTLPYTYKSLPSTLPPSSTDAEAQSSQDPTKPKFILSSSGQAAHPDDIIASCQALQSHLQKLHDDAKARLAKWETDIKERDLAEKRRLAPGWLDSDAKLLQPEKHEPAPAPASRDDVRHAPQASLLDDPTDHTADVKKENDAAGEELDRAFGGLDVTKNT